LWNAVALKGRTSVLIREVFIERLLVVGGCGWIGDVTECCSGGSSPI